MDLQRLTEKVEALEVKVDRLIVLAERGTGAWFLAKVLGGLVIGIALFVSPVVEMVKAWGKH